MCRSRALAEARAVCAIVARRLVRSLRCRPDPEPDRMRVLCRYSGLSSWAGRLRGRWPARRFGPECAWLSRDSSATWRIDAFPDANLCES